MGQDFVRGSGQMSKILKLYIRFPPVPLRRGVDLRSQPGQRMPTAQTSIPAMDAIDAPKLFTDDE